MFSPQDDYSAEDLGDEIVGLQLKCGKGGIYTLDGVQITIGPDGFEFTAFPSTAKWGFIKWVDRFPVNKQLYNWFDRPPNFEPLPDEDWSRYTGCYGVAEDGQLLTFTSALGLRKTLKNVITQYKARGQRLLPVCTLATKPRGDEYGNIDPILAISGWKDISVCAELFPGLIAMPRLAAPSTAPANAPAAIAPSRQGPPATEAPPPAEDDVNLSRAIDDDIPF
jgi:hypothetical protein